MAPSTDQNAEAEALRLKSMAEAKFKTSNNANSALNYAKRAQRLCPSLPGLSETVASLTVLAAPDSYSALGAEPFAPAAVVRRLYKKLALLLHPDENPHAPLSEAAFKLVGDAFRLLSDRTRRRDYDAELRRGMEAERETFSAGCSSCRLVHQFERRYLGQELVCPSCEKSFKGVEGVESDGDGVVRVRSERLRLKEMKKKEILVNGKVGSEKDSELGNEKEGRLKKRMCSVGEVLERSKSSKRVKNGEEMMTLAEFQNELKRKKLKGKKKEKEKKKKEDRIDSIEKRKNRGERRGLRDGGGLEIGEVRSLKKSEKHMALKRKGLRIENGRDSSGEELVNMAVVDSDFYDFDKDRVERSFKKGQVWAVYDDDDGMPRHYGLIDETVSVNPFEVKISWLDVLNSGDGKIVSREKIGLSVPCGSFKVARKANVNSVNIFSHVVDGDRVAREVYKIYPKKGSVWALYGEKSVDVVEEGKRCYDIIVFLTSYSEVNGLSMAYLEKVDGYKAVFKRQEKGSCAIRFLGKDEMGLVSHQIPARKLLCDETPELLKDCWELDPASLPSDLLTIGAIDN